MNRGKSNQKLEDGSLKVGLIVTVRIGAPAGIA